MIWELRSWSPIMDFVTSILYSTCICIRCAWKQQRRIWVLSIQPKVQFEFRQLPGASGTAFSKISKERRTWRGIPKFGKLFPGSFLSIQLCSPNFLNFRLSCSHFGNSTVSGIFLGNFCTICCCFQIFETFGSLNGNRPLYIDIKQ